ncbi:MAG: DUF421 domain-containing protein [Psychrobacter sp.]|jgi:uncharacterized membrane protein YcaP (DUF421 family)|uniref:DUF421 domain-containing protein n=1 Tax=Psychrobacter TaxID=497 RepID=UPI0004156473|nr:MULTISPECIES: YetF domain-containing protein [Psychrobacter]MAF75950.1 DUF421 domain-containing protein [Idiomarinaceae bacterium]MCG3881522.1 DUF421 domain-containing protein [Psychrobacter sp. Ps3]HAM61408.1 DUF421 domain-containing protein [Psychrobacter sp.]|tara:strand:+ start:5638 stop:6231 length:594 start_codon:yes stop_codon:yes gene_type:complete
MDWQTWFSINWQQVVGIALSVIGFYFCLILFTRIVGLRSFSKLSSYDLAMTVGIGSILASTVLSKSTSLLQGVFAIGMLFTLQAVLSIIRRKFKPFKALIDNQPIILMANGAYLYDNLKEAKLSENDIKQILRKNGIKSKSEVFAVIMETTADISVIKSSDTSPDWSLFDDIRDNEILVTTYDNGIEQQSRVDVFSK